MDTKEIINHNFGKFEKSYIEFVCATLGFRRPNIPEWDKIDALSKQAFFALTIMRNELLDLVEKYAEEGDE